MILSLIITYKKEFSIQLIEYFKSLNPINNFYFNFLPVGLDESDEEELLENITSTIENNTKIETVVVFADVGLPSKFARRIKFKTDKIKVLISKGSLVENGFLSYMLLNTKAPIETIEEIIDKDLKKDK